MTANPITTDVDFDTDGVQHGALKLPHSSEQAAWGAVLTPVTVIRNGPGPTALLTGANHGDEYEGPIALMNLARNLAAGDIHGRVIIIPMMNQPAFAAGRRTSPLDGGNMNRVFPGRPDGTPTEKVADYFQTTLLPLADVVLDIHSGGRTLEFVPFAAAHILDDAEHQSRCHAAMEAFNGPYGLLMRELDSTGMYDGAAEAMGKTFVTTELGGGGTATAATVGIAEKGIANLLRHAGIIDGAPEMSESLSLTMPDAGCFITGTTSGLVEYRVGLGAPVRAGDIIARVHDPEAVGAPPRTYAAAIDGILIGRHFSGLTRPGDNLAVIAVPI